MSAVLTAAGAISWLAFARTPAKVDARQTEANIARLTTSLLASSQLSHHPLDAELAGKLLARYLDALDSNRSVLLGSDVAEFDAMRATVADAIRMRGDTGPAHAIFARYLARLKQKVTFEAELLRTEPLSFVGHDSFQVDRAHAERPADLAAAHKLWKDALRAEVLAEKLSDEPPPNATATVLRRHQQQLRTALALGDEDILELYLDSLAHVYDPHSDYLGKQSMESFSIAMRLSLSGIGATLESVDGACTIHELVPGGPAAQSGALKPGDRIIAVAQGSSAPVDVTTLPLTRIVELIRGPKGSDVTLTVLPPAGDPGGAQTVRLRRAEVQLRDQQAKARIVDLPQANGPALRLGVIELPSFYTGHADDGATADVARLLDKLATEHVKGVVLDIRRNGGGSLDEAVSLTGLFIASGPVVQTRDASGAINVSVDRDPSIAYPGPLVVLTSRLSASASEILAGALQDYGRAPIVGDSTTFGKGTVQTILPLAPVMDRSGVGHAFDPGALKLTTGKFYRPGGGSTELRGVLADIAIPSPTEALPVGESKLQDPLPWDTVAPAHFAAVGEVAPYLQGLRAACGQRIASDEAMADLRRESDRLKARLSSEVVSLNEADRRREQTQDRRLREAIAAAAQRVTTDAPTYEITLADVGRPGLPAAARATVAAAPEKTHHAGAAARVHSASRDSAADELVLAEALRIAADYVRLRASAVRAQAN